MGSKATSSSTTATTSPLFSPNYEDPCCPFCDDVNKKYEKLMKIGHGTYGEVFQARCKTTGKLFALKKILMEHETAGFPITALREIMLLQQLKHENVIELVEVCRTKGTSSSKWKSAFFLVFPFCDHDLAGLLSNPCVKFSLSALKSLLKQFFTGIYFLHSNRCLHRDIKTANIFLTRDGVVRLGDFGLARPFSLAKTPHATKYTNRVITLWYRPPELLLGERNYGPAVDMWGAGCVFAELYTRTPIMQGTTETEQLNYIVKLCGSITPEVWPGVDQLELYGKFELPKNNKRIVKEKLRLCIRVQLALDLVDKLLALDPKARLDADQALSHDFFYEEPLPNQDELKKMLSVHKVSMFEMTRPIVRAAAPAAIQQQQQLPVPPKRSRLNSASLVYDRIY